MILQACSSCHRQYDVTHLPIGGRVRCVCGVLLTVERPKEATVRALKCTNCGGRVEPGDERCSYCAAELTVRDQASTLCPACFHRLEPDARHCIACGVEIAPQGLTALPEGQDPCPRCEGELAVRSLGEVSVVECTACLGLWVKREDFERICKRAQARPDVLLPGAAPGAEPVRAAEPERKVFYIPCPVCGEQMLRKMFRYKDMPSRVVLDYCRRHGVWFDAGELEAVVAFVRSRADVERPYRMEEGLERGRPRVASTIPIESAGGDWGVLGTFLVADVLGDFLGEVVGGLFD